MTADGTGPGPEETRTGYGEAEVQREDPPVDDGPEPRPVRRDRDAFRRTPPPAELRCDLCGAPVLDRHCKIVCLNCGYQRDCSDP